MINKKEQLPEILSELKTEFEELRVINKEIKIQYIKSRREKFYIYEIKVFRNKVGYIELEITSEDNSIIEFLKKEATKLEAIEGTFLVDKHDLEIRFINENGKNMTITLENAAMFNYKEIEENNKKINILYLRSSKEVKYHLSIAKSKESQLLKEYYINSTSENVEILTKEIIFEMKDFMFKLGIGREIYIEYSDEYGEIPSLEIRKKISLIISFFYDRKLLKVGEESFFKEKKGDYNKFEIKKIGLEIASSTHLVMDSRIFMIDYINKINLEKIFKKLIEENEKKMLEEKMNEYVEKEFKKTLEKIMRAYLKKSNKYKLDDLLERYLNNKAITAKYSIPIWVTGLESLANVICKENKADKLIDEKIFDTFKKNIKDIPSELEGKISRLNDISIGQKLKKLLEICFEDCKENNKSFIKECETAFKIRNDLNHGSTKVKKEKIIHYDLVLEKLYRELVLDILSNEKYK